MIMDITLPCTGTITVYNPTNGVKPLARAINGAGAHEWPARSRKPTYSNAILTFDIETTTVPNENYNPDRDRAELSEFNIVFCWQFLFYDPKTKEEIFVFGRKRKDFFLFLKRLQKLVTFTPIIWIHNLAYEYNNMAMDFIKGMDLIDDPPFFKSAVRPLYFRSYGFEFRCSAELTHKSLAKLGSDVGLEKLKSDFDYTKTRFPETELTPLEMEYCYRDVKILALAIAAEIEKYAVQTEQMECVGTLPYTQTGFVRNDIKNVFTKTKAGFNIMNTCHLDLDEFNFITTALWGGYTTANYNYLGAEIEKPLHVDLTSAYPAAMLLFKYPYGLHKSPVEPDFSEWKNYLSMTDTATITEIELHNIALDAKKAPFLPLAKIRNAQGEITANGKIMKLEYGEITLCDVDALLMLGSYGDMYAGPLTDDNVKIRACYRGDKRRLPFPVVATILKYFFGKTEYKGMPDKTIEYALSKQKLNGIYGLACQSLIHNHFILNGEKTVIDYGNDDFTENPTMPYQWAIYVTAYVRRWIYGFIQKLPNLNYWIYSDTDSMFLFDTPETNRLIEEHNKAVLAELEKINSVFPCIPKNKKGVPQYLGFLLNDEPCDIFCTIGAKRYYTIYKGHKEITFAGMSGTKTIIDGENYAAEIAEEYNTEKGADGINVQRLEKMYGSLHDAFLAIRDADEKGVELDYIEGVDSLIGVNVRLDETTPDFKYTAPNGVIYKDRTTYVLKRRSKEYKLIHDLKDLLENFEMEGVTYAGPQ